jgi:hypothetical protein
MQGTTKAVYDTADGTTSGTLSFFDNVGQRSFPETNLEDNQFQIGEALAVEAVVLTVFDTVNNVFLPYQIGGNPVLTVKVANQTILKRVPLSGLVFNKTGTNNGVGKLWLNVPLVIPPQVRFTAELENFISQPNRTVQLYFFGTGVLLNLKSSL